MLLVGTKGVTRAPRGLWLCGMVGTILRRLILLLLHMKRNTTHHKHHHKHHNHNNTNAVNNDNHHHYSPRHPKFDRSRVGGGGVVVGPAVEETVVVRQRRRHFRLCDCGGARSSKGVVWPTRGRGTTRIVMALLVVVVTFLILLLLLLLHASTTTTSFWSTQYSSSYFGYHYYFYSDDDDHPHRHEYDWLYGNGSMGVIPMSNDGTNRTTTTIRTTMTNTEWTCPAITINNKSVVPPLRPRNKPSVDLVDVAHGIKLMGAPKGGASLVAQLFFRHLGLLDEAEAYHPFIHEYRKKWIREQQQKQQNSTTTTSTTTTCPKVCRFSSSSSTSSTPSMWTCIILVRNPLDRAVSAYIHTMRTPIRNHFPELQSHMQRKMSTTSNDNDNDNHRATVVDQASFADFVAALQARAQSEAQQQQRVHSLLDDHFMPQADYTCRGGGIRSSSSTTTTKRRPRPLRIFYIPIEAVEPALEKLMEYTGVRLNATGLTSGHYVTKQTPVLSNASTTTTTTEELESSSLSSSSPLGLQLPDVSHEPFPSILKHGKSSSSSSTTLPYEAYYQNDTLNQLVCQLYCHDFVLYRQICTAPWLVAGDDANAIQRICQAELHRIATICPHLGHKT